ncbi:MAG: glycoside hydrolase family 2 protein [Oscillospiraceae bacterium]|nr:glycoside hydrolase family 2 protein [Oscillospiraceae bacterium]MBQ7130774.1 glycoside hydrolase family 2 protein [Oscillospiraceae bacterium]
MLSLCNQWEFVPEWFDGFALGEGEGEPVRLPHTVKECPLHYTDHMAYQTVCGYRRKIELGRELEGKHIFLQFDGAAHIATVYINGKEAAHHRTGYTGFRVEITELAALGEENILAVKLDTTENPQIPPFGFVVDYLTYGGLYREVWLDVKEKSYIRDLFITTPTLTTLKIRPTVHNGGGCILLVELQKGEHMLLRKAFTAGGTITIDCPNVKPWDTEHPVRYTCRVSLLKIGKVLDVQEHKIGFRTAEFKADGFWLNGKKTFLRGLNRHQCWPYAGYAVPEALQREDARILKEELSCVAVRTSHYPQSQHFIDECDRLGLLVFTEIPGWQHIGGEDWKKQAVENTREMILQYRNHPSIILWGVRINESQDCDELYQLTNTVARDLDPSRATSGVRYIEKSSLLEDVYAYNDFSHTGDNPGCKPKKNVMAGKKPLLISEHNGHMFPTKSFDTWQRRQEHALRHMRVLNDAAADSEHAGCFGWCMFDYATHKDFGSGDRICYHGVMDAFRNPKLAAYAYASQGEGHPVLAVGSSMDIGDYPAGSIGDILVFTNADSVSLYKNNMFVTTLTAGDWKGLPHGPMVLNDTVGCLLETQEGFDKKKADLLRECLLTIQRKGLANMAPADIAKMGYAMVKYGLKYEDAVALYGKYIGNWGGEATVWRLIAVKNGEVIATHTCKPSARLHLEVMPSHVHLKEGNTYDMASVRVRIVDENGNVAPYAQLPVQFTLEGDAQLVGPAVVTAEGGMTGTYLKTTGKSGEAKLTIHTDQTEDVTLLFKICAETGCV